MSRTPKTPSASPADVLWQTRTIIAAMLMGEGLALVLTLAPGAGNERWVYFGLTSLMIQWVILLTLAILLPFRKLLTALAVDPFAWAAMLALMICTWLVGGLAWLLFRDVWPLALDTANGFFLRLTGIAATVGLLALAAFQNHWNANLLAVKAKQAELQALQARTHPHFLFNTLNTGAALVHARPEAAEHLLLDLADLFRAALSGPSHIELHAELDLVKRYLSIEQLRLGDRLKVRWDVPDPLPATLVPSLSLQPLAENAVRHGIERRVEGGEILIRVAARRDMLELEVKNEVAASPGTPLSGGYGVGLASVEQRVREMSQDEGSLTTSVVDGQFVARISLPRIPGSGEYSPLRSGAHPITS